jgi:hypothetical protein
MKKGAGNACRQQKDTRLNCSLWNLRHRPDGQEELQVGTTGPPDGAALLGSPFEPFSQ